MKKFMKKVLLVLGIGAVAFIALMIIAVNSGGEETTQSQPNERELAEQALEFSTYGVTFGEDQDAYNEWLNNHIAGTIEDHARFFRR